MFKRMKFGARLFAIVAGIVIVSFTTVAIVVSFNSVRSTKTMAFELTDETAARLKSDVLAEMQGARITAETLSYVYETLIADGLTDRAVVNDILAKCLINKEYITAFCAAFEPNGFDGNDMYYSSLGPENDETGRYAPYYNKQNGNLDVEPLKGIDTADWYAVPKATKSEYLTDPYVYKPKGGAVELVSFIFPVLSTNGDFLGIVSSDIQLDKFREIAEQVTMDSDGAVVRVFANNGVIVAHPDNEYMGRSVLESLALDSIRGGDIGPSQVTADTAGEFISDTRHREAEAIAAAIKGGKKYIDSTDDYYTVYAPIQFTDNTKPWSVAVSVPMRDVQKPSDDLLAQIIPIMGAALAFLLVSIYLVARSVSKPIYRLAWIARELEEGRFDVEFSVKADRSEVGRLSRALRSMASRISKQIEDMKTDAKEAELKNQLLEEMNSRLIAAKEIAEEASKAKGDFLSNMSHEMRTPLNAVIGMTSIGIGSADVIKKDYAFGKIQDAGNHLLGVINDVLDMSKIEANKLELNDVAFSFERMLSRVVGVINFRVEEKHQTLRVHIDPDIPDRLMGDDQRLAQVIANLLSNAVKFTPDDGEIKLATRIGGLSKRDGEDIALLHIDVTDSGIGISAEQQAKLFTSFQQADSSTSRRFGGTGLGLAISKRIVEMMDGEISVDSRLGAGATFSFSVKMRVGEQNHKGLLDPTIHWGNVRLLAVDDDPDILEYFKDAALRLGVKIDIASTGEAALEMLKSGVHHDIYFIDWRMPGISGIELAKEIREHRANDAVVTLISASEWSAVSDAAREAGVDRFLPKPLFNQDLADCINECLSGETGKEEESDELPDFTGKRMLLAEDVEINREILITLLESTGIEVDSAENGSECVFLFSQNPENYDIIFMDLQMPVMDGIEATRNIREAAVPKAKTIPIIAMTANVFKEDVERCISAGMNGHLGKPLELPAVIEKLEEFLLNR